mmetsp:Transcript_97684/g.304322  ORF Transcript_97684/g.304322 Transcript_97684/m.304322 type:complete len:207 (+) Transcript_97684:26-646(+)|eukprot:CAMPEP_0204514882 /NCGR_PEP_ID=MMETSP0661-20131031/2321_1 /ASSEMBLY_ACC=CAM_ASM_000606 /TAXON_ID=109239 /ORGANISM="Alexandrium margalefi, Strain AMGDE01CS-322" /LENGTH=206 /DNA_ID=CAMNT_0051520161 /DNA_START=25 /DNA_END=645 /DNA_ORIENTATION=+
MSQYDVVWAAPQAEDGTADGIPQEPPVGNPEQATSSSLHRFRVAHKPRVILRSTPVVGSCGVAVADAGEILEAAEIRDGWARLTDEEAARRGVVPGDQAWGLIDGSSLGLGELLQPLAPPARGPSDSSSRRQPQSAAQDRQREEVLAGVRSLLADAADGPEEPTEVAPRRPPDAQPRDPGVYRFGAGEDFFGRQELRMPPVSPTGA